MTALAELAARVAPDYARMLAALARAMLPGGEESTVPAAIPPATQGRSELPHPTAAPRGRPGAGEHDARLQSASRPRAPAAEVALAPAGVTGPAGIDVAATPAGHKTGSLATDGHAGAVPAVSRDVIDPSPEGRRPCLGQRNRPGVPPSVGRAAPPHVAGGVAPPRLSAALSTGPLPSRPGGASPGPASLAVADAPPGGDLRIRLAKPGRALPVPADAPRLPVAAAPVLTVTAWPAPDLAAPRDWPAEPPAGPDPFADAALEDALDALLERTALAGGIDL